MRSAHPSDELACALAHGRVRRPYGGSEDAARNGREEFPFSMQPVRIWPKDKRVAADKVVDNEALEQGVEDGNIRKKQVLREYMRF